MVKLENSQIDYGCFFQPMRNIAILIMSVRLYSALVSQGTNSRRM